MWKNISDGKSDGIVIMYMKDEELHAVALTQEQADMLDLSIAMPFMESKIYIANKVTVRNGKVIS